MNEQEKDFETIELPLDQEPLVGRISMDEMLAELRFGWMDILAQEDVQTVSMGERLRWTTKS